MRGEIDLKSGWYREFMKSCVKFYYDYRDCQKQIFQNFSLRFIRFEVMLFCHELLSTEFLKFFFFINSWNQVFLRFQNKALRDIIDAPCYCRNSVVHRDLQMDTIEQTSTKFASSHKQRLRWAYPAPAQDKYDKKT